MVRWLLVLGSVFCFAFLVQGCIVAVRGEPLESRLGARVEIGSNGLSFRFLWSRDGMSEIAWDDLAGLPRWRWREDEIFVEVPLWAGFVLVAASTGALARYSRTVRARPPELR